jgi:glycine/D-amino acid oxidase-like deaminating enzyme
VTTYHFAIVGQGLAGSILAYELFQLGHQVTIYDKGHDLSASRCAAGLYNPITGRKMVKTWMADELFEDLESYYFELQKMLGVEFLHPLPIYRPFFSVEELNDWMGRASSPESTSFIGEVRQKSIGLMNFNDPYGGILLKKSGYVDLPVLLKSFRKYFIYKGILKNELFDWGKVECQDTAVMYEEQTFDRVISCEGPAVNKNAFFRHLKFKPVKGELLDVRCQLKSNLILNRGVFMIPKEGFYTIGSNYDHSILDWTPSEKGLNSIMDKLSRIFVGEVDVINHRAGIRPATFDRRPFIGFHPDYKRIGIFNGFGAKGVTLIPYFAKHLIDHIFYNKEVMPEVSLLR